MIDTHCHIDLYPNPKEIAHLCANNNVVVIAMTNLPSHFEMGLPHVKSFKNIRFSLGLHPQYANRHQQEYQIFKNNIQKTSYIGEIGLDFSKEFVQTKDLQIKYFKQILHEIAGLKKILNLHSRKAEKEVYDYLKEYNIRCAIFHWYSGPLQLIDTIANSGYFFSINLKMFQSQSGKNIIRRIPQDNILTETDGPFTSNFGRISKPTDVQYMYKPLSEIWEVSELEAKEIIDRNFKRLIKSLIN